MVCEVGQPGGMAPGLDEEIPQIRRRAVGSRTGVSGPHHTVIVDRVTGFGDLASVLATDEALSRFVAYQWQLLSSGPHSQGTAPPAASRALGGSGARQAAIRVSRSGASLLCVPECDTEQRAEEDGMLTLTSMGTTVRRS